MPIAFLSQVPPKTLEISIISKPGKCLNKFTINKEINVTISVDDKVLYNGFLKAYEIPMLLEKKKMRVGFYKVSAKCNNIQVQHRFFYFFQKTIWIDFDFATNDILLVSKFYKQIPL